MSGTIFALRFLGFSEKHFKGSNIKNEIKLFQTVTGQLFTTTQTVLQPENHILNIPPLRNFLYTIENLCIIASYTLQSGLY